MAATTLAVGAPASTLGDHPVDTVQGHKVEDSVAHDPATERGLAQQTLAATAADAQAAEAAVAGNEHEVGSWGPLVNWPVVGVHVALLANGKVLAYDSVGDAATETFPVHDHTRATLWDPATGTHTPVWVNTGFNIFCSGLAHLSDGTLFLAGGNKNSALAGLVQTHTFNHGTNTWSLGPNMAAERWYPTVTPLRNGEMLITEGGPNIPEVRTTGGNLRSLSTASLNLPLYPWIDVAPNGRAFYSGPDQTMRGLDTSGTGSWQSLGQRDNINRDYGSHALFDVGKILVAGGGGSSADARVVNLTGATPQVTPTAPMANGRRQHNLTVLADGTVLATGGNSSGASLVDLNNGVYEAELWNPATGTWRTLAAEQATRQYHSTALLLPDGRVVSSGGGICGNCDDVGYLAKNAQVFTPPYLYKADGSGELAPRPAITGAPATIDHATNFQIDTPDAASISKVALVRLGAVTHSVNMEQRYVPLSFTAGAGALTATAPPNADIAPPGVYMLFTIDAAGVPSIARMVTVSPPGPDTTPPSAPTALTATAAGGTQIDLGWTASTDNVGVTGYRVERCQGAGCTNFSQVGTPAGTSFNDTGRSPSTTYRYQVRAADAAGNLGAYSGIATATTPAVVDTTPPSAPTGANATAVSSTQIDLGWTASTDNVGVTGYRVERCQGAGCTNFVQVGTPAGTSFNDTGRSPSTTYRYQVRAADAAGNLSAYSAVAEATTGAGPPTPLGLVGAWGFSEGSGGTTADASGNGNTGTITAASWSTQGRHGNALSFNGTNSVVRIPSSASLNVSTGMTLSAWIRPAAAQSGYRTILQRQVDAYFLTASSGDPLHPAGGGTFGGSIRGVDGPTANPLNTWTHVALTYDGGTLRLYLNGTQVATRAATGSIQTTTNPLWIGGNQPYGDHFNGLIDEARVYNRALSQADIQTDMNTPVSPPGQDTTPPSAPTGANATAVSSTQIDLGWTASTDNVGVTGYRVERCQGAGCTNFSQVGTPTGTSFNDTGRSPSTTYRYQVRAADAAGNLGPYSGIVSATTQAPPDTTPPSAPTALTATAAGGTQIDLGWTASTDNVGVTGYRVERCQGAGCTNFVQVGTPAGTSFNDTGRSPSTTYRYQVRAADAAGNLGAYSGIATATTPAVVDTTPPSAPTGANATAVSSTQIDLGWTASTDNVGVTGYRVERCQGAGCTNFSQVGTPAGTSFNDTGRSPSTTYRYQVRAADAAGNLGAYSGIATATTPAVVDTTPPSAPTALTATAAGGTQIDLGWTASTDNVGVTGYRVERCQGAGCTNFVQVGTPAGTSFNDTGRSPSTTYRYQVRAADAAGNLGAYSGIATATTPAVVDTTPPSAPTALTATAAGGTQIDLGWTASTDNVGVTGYRVERCQGAGCTNFSQVGTPAGTSFNDTGRSPSTTYRYQVRAADAAGNLGAYSGIATATTPAVVDTTPPSAPTGANATAVSSTQIDLGWTASTDNVGVTGYRVERCQGAGCTNFVQVGTPAGTSFNDTGRSPSTTYRYQVRAADAAGNLSAYSAVAEATTGAGPPTPLGLVGAWGFSEGSGGTTADASGNGNTGTITAASWSTQGRHGNALSFNGTNSVVRIPSSASLNVSTGMTLSAWIRPAAAQSGYRTILQRQVDAYFLTASSGDPLHPAGGGTFGGSIRGVDGPTANPLNTWTHVALTYDGGTLRLYLNGTQVATRAATGSIQTTTNPLWIGGNQPYGDHFNGLIDEARVYNRALSQADIQTDMNTPVSPPGQDTTPPSAPTGANATAVSSTQIDLGWTASTDNVGVTGYRVERCQGAGCTNFVQVGTPAGTSFNDTGRSPSTTYRYQVRAADAAGNLGPYSGIVSATTQAPPDTTPPSAPTALTATAAGGTQIDLGWTASTDNVGVTGYRVERCQGAGCTNFSQVGTPAGTSFNDTGRSPSTTYRYQVRAADAAGNLGAYSGIATATTPAVVDTTPPSAPTGANATAVSSTQIDLGWTASTDNVGVTGYRVERCQGAGCTNFVQVGTPAGTSFNDTGRSPSTTYRYQVRAADAAGNLSAYSAVAEATTGAGPPTPLGLVGAWGFSEGSGGTTADASGNGNTGTITAASWSTQGRHGNALSFNGTNSVVRIPSSASLNVSTGMTLSAWIRPAAAQSGYRTILQRQVDAYFLTASSGDPLHPAGGGTFGGSIRGVDGPTANPLNTWTHVALTYDGGTLRLYLNGTQVATRAATGSIQTTTNPLWIGGNQPYGDHFNGLIDEARVYNRALSQADIQTDMNTAIDSSGLLNPPF